MRKCSAVIWVWPSLAVGKVFSQRGGKSQKSLWLSVSNGQTDQTGASCTHITNAKTYTPEYEGLKSLLYSRSPPHAVFIYRLVVWSSTEKEREERAVASNLSLPLSLPIPLLLAIPRPCALACIGYIQPTCSRLMLSRQTSALAEVLGHIGANRHHSVSRLPLNN